MTKPTPTQYNWSVIIICLLIIVFHWRNGSDKVAWPQDALQPLQHPRFEAQPIPLQSTFFPASSEHGIFHGTSDFDWSSSVWSKDAKRLPGQTGNGSSLVSEMAAFEVLASLRFGVQLDQTEQELGTATSGLDFSIKVFGEILGVQVTRLCKWADAWTSHWRNGSDKVAWPQDALQPLQHPWFEVSNPCYSSTSFLGISLFFPASSQNGIFHGKSDYAWPRFDDAAWSEDATRLREQPGNSSSLISEMAALEVLVSLGIGVRLDKTEQELGIATSGLDFSIKVFGAILGVQVTRLCKWADVGTILQSKLEKLNKNKLFPQNILCIWIDTNDVENREENKGKKGKKKRESQDDPGDLNFASRLRTAFSKTDLDILGNTIIVAIVSGCRRLYVEDA